MFADVTILHNFHCMPRIFFFLRSCHRSEAVNFCGKRFSYYFKVMFWDRWSKLVMFITHHIHQEANVKAWNGFLSILYLNVVVVVVFVLLWWWWFPSLSVSVQLPDSRMFVAFCPEQQKVGQVRPINIEGKSPTQYVRSFSLRTNCKKPQHRFVVSYRLYGTTCRTLWDR